VFVGATARGFGDRFATPYSREMPGVEVLASAAANLSSGRALQRDDVTWGMDIALAAAVALIGAMAASRPVPIVALLVTVGVWGGTLAGVHLAFLHGLWLDGTTALAALLTATSCGTAARLLLQREAAANLARYQSPLMTSVLSARAQPAFDGRVQLAAVLFVDLTGFTARSKALGPVATTAFLRDFHRMIETAAISHCGMIEQFAGDGVMICFGLPEPHPSDAANGLACANALFAGVEAMNAQPDMKGQPPLEIRIGLHFGEVSAAILGGKHQGHVTFVGDVVNSASRLQGIARELGTDFVVSNDLVAAVGDSAQHGLTYAGEIELRGRDAPMAVWIRPSPDPRDGDPG
jgi:adenylate cyclase